MTLLCTNDLKAFYGDFQALFGITTELKEGETVAIIGANGAGKSTFLRTVAGMLHADPDAVMFDGQPIGGRPAAEIVKLGIAMVPEGRKLFPSLSVEENVLIGRYGRKAVGHWDVDSVGRLFPILRERRDSPSTVLSGGEQQMVAIARALMSNPRVLLCDELSLGLAPIVIKSIYETFPQIKKQGTSLIIVEQDIVQAMAVADRVYCFQEGRMTLSGKPVELTKDTIHAAYFGT